MDNAQTRQYLEPGFVSHNHFLEQTTYSEILDSIVVGCVDVVITQGTRILLGKRAWHPQKDWWLIGGRMITAERLEQTAARHLQHDLGLNIDESRFSYLTSFATAWKLRRHPPADHGTHTVSMVMTVEVTDQERQLIKPGEELLELGWYEPKDIMTSRRLHSALKQCAAALQRRLDQAN
jgi:ADP-ribose pyrophosphatase YjhB (NUDIX family)